jgi:hypothetical protein
MMLPRALVLTFSALVVMACAAAFPVVASATLSPTLSVNESAGSAAGSASSVGFDISFNPASGDAVKTLAIDLPPGLLVNEEIDGGACLSTTAPAPACQIGSGTALIAGTSTPMSLYLVKAPTTAYLAGVELVAGSLSIVGDITFRSSTDINIQPSLYVGAEIEFNALPSALPIDSMGFSLTGLTLPSSCQQTQVVVWASSEQRAYPWHALAPYTVTGCTALAYQPTSTEAVSRFPNSSWANFVINVVDPAGDSTSQSIKLQIPPGLALSRRMDPCLNGEKCTVGTVTATSPIMPTSQLTGTITLTGSNRVPSLSVSFPSPVGLELSSSLTAQDLDLLTLPDIPLTDLKLDFTGDKQGPMWVTQCYPTLFQTIFTPRSGATAFATNTAVNETGCKATQTKSKPTALASMSGLRADAPRFTVKATEGRLSPAIKSLSITLPSGLSLSAGALSYLSKQSLSLSGAKLGSARIRGGVLVVTLRGASARVKVSLGGPLLLESAALHTQAVAGHGRYRHVAVLITDARGTRTKLKLTAHATT